MRQFLTWKLASKTSARSRQRKLSNDRRLARGHRDVGDAKLHALRALVAVDTERPRDMERLAAIFRERAAEFLADAAKRDAVDQRAVARFQANAQVRLPDLVGEHQLMIGERN